MKKYHSVSWSFGTFCTVSEINGRYQRLTYYMFKSTVVLLILYLVSFHGNAQLSGEFSLGTGNNYTSIGQYGKLFGQIAYQTDGWSFSSAAGAVFSHARENKFDALRLSVARDFSIKDKPYAAKIFYQRTPFSTRMNEHDAGIVFIRNTNRWYFNVGANTRCYQLTHKYADAHSYSANNLWEPVNAMYKVTYHIPIQQKYECNISVANFDDFIIEQETNPFLMADFRCQVSEKSKLYLSMMYQQAGLFNISVSYFGYYLKAGYVFDINLSDKTSR